MGDKWQQTQDPDRPALDRALFPLRLVLFLSADESFLSRLTGAINLHDDEITRLTDTELWLERPDGDVIKYRKKEINSG